MPTGKCPKLRIRRNTVVKHKDGTFYGRVIRVLPNGEIFWLCCGYHFHISPPENLEADGYKGRVIRDWDNRIHAYRDRFSHMTSLRDLKRRSAQFHREFAHNTPLDYENIRRH